MPDISGVKIAPVFNVIKPQTKEGSQKTIAETYYDMYSNADSLAFEDINIKKLQMFPQHMSDDEIYKMRTERTAFHLNNMIAMFNKACEQPYKETTEKSKE